MRSQYLLAIVAAAVLAAAGRAFAEDPLNVYVSVFGAKAKAVAATPETKDDLALAGELVDAARQAQDDAPLRALLCERAYEFAMKAPDGYPTALEALGIIAAADPSRKVSCLERGLTIRERQFSAASDAQKTRASRSLVAAMESLGDARADADDFSAAETLYRRAMSLASGLTPASRQTIQRKLDAVVIQGRTAKSVELLKYKLGQDTSDNAARESLIDLYVIELDRPADAKKLLTPDADPTKAKLVSLAAKAIDQQDEAACAELGDWYRDLAGKATAVGKPLMLAKARAYYARFLALHAAQDSSRLKIKLSADQVDKDLAALGEPPSAPVVSPKVRVMPLAAFDAAYGAKFLKTSDLATGGTAKASSVYTGRSAQNVLGGSRTAVTWTLIHTNPSGTFEAAWDPAVKGRYVLLFVRPPASSSHNPWTSGSIKINDAPVVRVENVQDSDVMIVDLGSAVPVSSLKLDIVAGTGVPGLAALEIHGDVGDLPEQATSAPAAPPKTASPSPPRPSGPSPSVKGWSKHGKP